MLTWNHGNHQNLGIYGISRAVITLCVLLLLLNTVCYGVKQELEEIDRSDYCCYCLDKLFVLGRNMLCVPYMLLC